MPVPSWCRHLGSLALAVAISPAVSSARVDDSQSWAVWTGSQVAFSWPTGEFRPPSSERALGYGLQASFVPPHFPLGLRFEYGTVVHRSHVDSVRVDNPNGYWVDNLQGVQTGSRLSWGMVGAQWDLRSRASSIYLYAMVGAERVSPMEKLGDGYPVIEADVPGLPRSGSGFAWSTGMGARIRVPGRENLAITGEFDYRRLGEADYVAAPGVRGDYPNTRYVVARGPVETVTVRIGFALYCTPR